MLERLEARWKKGSGAEQEQFILAMYCNPYTRGYCFNREFISGADLFDRRLCFEAARQFDRAVPARHLHRDVSGEQASPMTVVQICAGADSC